MTCDHYLWDEPGGLQCDRNDTHTTHSYHAAWAPDRHDRPGTDDE